MNHLVPLLCMLPLAFTPPENAPDDPKPIFVHYMPWYASKPVSGQWGWHWTMNHFDPDQVDDKGRRQAASHDYPLIGLYDSGDPAALECQVQLMKLAGIDGVIVDWYGVSSFNDYGLIHRNTTRLVEQLKKAGLKFAICYEDQTINHMTRGGFLEAKDDVAEGRKTLAWLDAHWFHDPSYLQLDGRPVLLVFGPQHFEKPQWAELTRGLVPAALLFGLPHLSARAGMPGCFGWPPAVGGREITPEVWQTYLETLDNRAAQGEPVIAVAFPAFHDIYREAGLHDSYGRIDDRQGKTLSDSLALARQGQARLIQVATWNDYGEGTIVEPTREQGYTRLEILQRSSSLHAPNTPADLRLPVQLYQLRKQHTDDPAALADLDRASASLFAGHCDEARQILDRYASPAANAAP